MDLFPWSRFLSPDDLATFSRALELALQQAQEAGDDGGLAAQQVEHVITWWRDRAADAAGGVHDEPRRGPDGYPFGSPTRADLN